MSTIVVYDGDGAIVRSVIDFNESLTADDFAPNSIVRLQGNTRISKSQHYVSDGVVTARPATTCSVSQDVIDADGVDEAVVSDIPAGSSVVVAMASGTTESTVNDGSIAITADDPGEIHVTITPPFPSKSLTISVIAA